MSLDHEGSVWVTARQALTAMVAVALLSIPAALTAQADGVSIGKAANRLTVTVDGDSAVVTLSDVDPDDGGIATTRMTVLLPEARVWANNALARVASCRVEKTRTQHATTLYDRAARDDRGEGKLPKAHFSCGRGHGGESAFVDVAMTGNYTATHSFSSFRDARQYFESVAKALATSGSAANKR